MKKYTYILLAAAFAFAACEKEAAIQENTAEEPSTNQTAPEISGDGLVTYTISVGMGDKTKAYGAYDGEFYWENGDQIDVWDTNSSSFKTFTYSGYSGEETVTFSASLPEGTYSWTNAYYPSGVESGETTVTIPSAYASPDAAKPILCGVVSGSALAFHHICAYARVQVNNWPSIADKLIFSSTSTLAGTYTVDPSTGDISAESSASTSITVTCTTPAVYPGYDVEVWLPIVPSDDHTFSLKMQDSEATPHTFLDNAGSHSYNLPKGKLINMAEVDLAPKVYILADWRDDEDIDDDNLLDGDVWPCFYIDNQIVLDAAKLKFHIVVKYGDLEVPYGFASSTSADSGEFLPWSSGDAILSTTGLYFIEFNSPSGWFATSCHPAVYLAGISDDWKTDYNVGMTRIVHNVYAWRGDPDNTAVRPYGLDFNWITSANMTTVSGEDNIVIVNTDAPNDSEESFVAQGSFGDGDLSAGDKFTFFVHVYVNDASYEALEEDGDSGFVCAENVKLASASTIYFSEEWHNPDTYRKYGLSSSGQTLVDGSNQATVLDGNAFTLAAGTYDIFYNVLNKHVYIVKK